MKDILGRELHDGDICVGKGTGRYVRGMDVGIWSGKSIAFKGGNKRSMGDVFLVVNPSEEELEIKREIETALEIIENKRLARDSINTIPLSKLEVGGIYKCINGHNYIYLGKRKVTLHELRYDKTDIQEGHCFCWCFGNTDDEIRERITKINRARECHDVIVLKGNKKLCEHIRTISLEFPLVRDEVYNRYTGSCNYRLTIE